MLYLWRTPRHPSAIIISMDSLKMTSILYLLILLLRSEQEKGKHFCSLPRITSKTWFRYTCLHLTRSLSFGTMSISWTLWQLMLEIYVSLYLFNIYQQKQLEIFLRYIWNMYLELLPSCGKSIRCYLCNSFDYPTVLNNGELVEVHVQRAEHATTLHVYTQGGSPALA